MIIISGVSRGIGKFLYDWYIEMEEVWGTYNNTQPTSNNSKGNLLQVDVCDYSSVEKFYHNIPLDKKKITLINCAGITDNSFAHKSDPNLWKRVIETNIIGTYHMTRVVLPIMRENNYGRIINFSSVVAQKGTSGVSAYAASKSALWGFAKSLAQENGSKGITINNINLGYASIGMGVDKVPLKYQIALKEQIPSKTFCDPSEIIKTVDYLRENNYLNGVSIDLSGGLV